MTTTFRCPKCEHVTRQPSTSRNVHHKCPVTRRIEAYDRDPDQLRMEAATGGDAGPFASFPQEGQP